MKRIIIVLTVFLLLGAIGAAVYCIYQDDDIEFTVGDTLADGQGKKARVILLGGQSNASGCSSDDYLQKKRQPREIRRI